MIHDIRLAARLMLKSKGFAIVAILTLGLGIGANTAIFSFINAFFLKSFTVRDPAGIVTLYTTDEVNPGMLPTSHFNFRDYQEGNQVFAAMAEYSFAPANMQVNGEPSQVFGEIVSGNFFDLLGVRATIGRTFLPEEYANIGTHPVVVLSYAFWRNQLGGDPNAVGTTLTMNGNAFTVIGVAPADFRGLNTLNSPAFWVTTASYKQILTGLFLNFMENRRALLFNVVARLKPGVSIEQADAALKPISAELASQYPNDNKGRGLRLVPLAESGINPNQRGNFVLAGTLLLSLAALVLLIACANLANLLLARATARQREVAVRLSLGADRKRIIRQFLTESLMLAAFGGIAGILIAQWTQHLLWSLRPPFFPQDFTISLDGRVMFFAMVVSLLTGLLFGLAPAWTATKPSLTTMLKEESNGSSAGSPLWSFRNALVAAQISLSVIALIVAGLFIRSLRNAQDNNPGWNTTNVALFSVDLSAQGYSREAANAYYKRALELVRATPGVEDATVATNPLLAGGGALRTIRPQCDNDKLRTTGQLMSYNHIAPGYFAMMGIPMISGRDFTEMDDAQHPTVITINEQLAKMAWPGEDPIGKTVKLFGSEDLVEVVGVTRTVTYDNIGEDAKPFLFFSMYQEPARGGFGTIHVRTRSDAAAMVPTLRKQLQSLDPALPFVNVTTIDDNIAQGLWAPRTGAALLSIFGVLALLLAAMGVYGIMSYTVSRRTREIGIRMAIGAQPADVLNMVLVRGLIVAGAGLFAGLALAFTLTRFFQNLLYGVSASDPLTFGAIALVLAGIALLASWLPARRATKVNPLSALRAE